MYDVTPRVEIDAQGGWSEYQAHRLAYTRNVPVEPVVSASDKCMIYIIRRCTYVSHKRPAASRLERLLGECMGHSWNTSADASAWWEYYSPSQINAIRPFWWLRSTMPASAYRKLNTQHLSLTKKSATGPVSFSAVISLSIMRRLHLFCRIARADPSRGHLPALGAAISCLPADWQRCRWRTTAN